MHRTAESQEKFTLQTADLIENLLSVVAAMIRASELNHDDRNRIQKSLAETLEIVASGGATAKREQDHRSIQPVPTVAESRASADE